MKIAISAAGPNLESSIDERFGRCHYFIIVETDGRHSLPNEKPVLNMNGNDSTWLTILMRL